MVVRLHGRPISQLPASATFAFHCADDAGSRPLFSTARNGVFVTASGIKQGQRYSPAIDYLNILSEISGFIDSCRCDVNIIVGDFNVDFDRRGLLCDLLTTFMSDMNLTACDLFFRQEIKYTYERDDTMARSLFRKLEIFHHHVSFYTGI